MPAVAINAVFIGVMLTYMIMPGMEALPLWYNILTVGAGQVAACYGLGIPLFGIIKKLADKNQNMEEKKK